MSEMKDLPTHELIKQAREMAHKHHAYSKGFKSESAPMLDALADRLEDVESARQYFQREWFKAVGQLSEAERAIDFYAYEARDFVKIEGLGTGMKFAADQWGGRARDYRTKYPKEPNE